MPQIRLYCVKCEFSYIECKVSTLRKIETRAKKIFFIEF